MLQLIAVMSKFNVLASHFLWHAGRSTNNCYSQSTS